MTYELAKQLKDAGFPQHNIGEHYSTLEGDIQHYEYAGLSNADVAIPTLSELIAALGNDLIMWHSPQGWHVSRQLSIDKWPDFPPSEIIEAEVTENELDIALARLFIRLNESRKTP